MLAAVLPPARKLGSQASATHAQQLPPCTPVLSSWPCLNTFERAKPRPSSRTERVSTPTWGGAHRVMLAGSDRESRAGGRLGAPPRSSLPEAVCSGCSLSERAWWPDLSLVQLSVPADAAKGPGRLTMVDLPESTLPMTATRTSSGEPVPPRSPAMRRRMHTSATARSGAPTLGAGSYRRRKAGRTCVYG